jgi:alkylation response protein AidB-like acyl-CoA dehydrogenase
MLRLPHLAESLTQAKVVSWLVAEGDVVQPGKGVVEVDAEKFVVELEVEQPCLVEHILQRAGAMVNVGGALARLAPVPSPSMTHDDSQGFQLEPLTNAGKRFCALAGEHARAVAPRAEHADREGRLLIESFTEMRESGFAAACVPESLGGGGLSSLHDLAVGISRIGRADASTAIALNMHLATTWAIARAWRFASEPASPYEHLLRAIAEGRVLQCTVGTEVGTDILHPLTEARRHGHGWRINGRKCFGTLSEAADLIHMTIRVSTSDGDTISIATIPRDAPGLVVCNDWNGLGMRASGSHTIELHDCFVTDAQLTAQGRWGEWSPAILEGQVSGNIGLLGAFLGIAEAARSLVLPELRTRRPAPADRPLSERPGIQHGVARLEISLAAMRAILGRVGAFADAALDGVAPGRTELAAAHSLMREFQCAKWYVNRGAIDVVDQAMTLSGGSGYRAASPLARLYRDVRAGPFMQLFSPNEAFDYIGQGALGLTAEAG